MALDPESYKFRLSLLDNGLDFILKGIDELFDNEYFLNDIQVASKFSPANFKYGILHLFAGFLLVLKDRLARHIPELIYKGQITSVRERLAAGKFPNTVDFDELLERLEIGPKVTFATEDLKVIRRMQNWRNAFEHAEVELDKREVWKTLSRFLDIVDDFLVGEMGVELENSESGKNLSNKIKKIDAVWRREERRLADEVHEELKKNLSQFRKNRAQNIEDIEWQQRDPSDSPHRLLFCNTCGSESVVTGGEFEGVCYKCEEVHPIRDCIRCTDSMTGYYWNQDLCDACEDYVRTAE